MIARLESWTGASFLAGAVWALSAVIPTSYLPICWGLVALGVTSAGIESALVAPVVVRNFRVDLTRSGFVVHRGALWRSIDHVPWSKVTVVRRQDGPLLRRLGMCRCVIFTPAREVTLMPMAPQDAELIVLRSRRAGEE